MFKYATDNNDSTKRCGTHTNAGSGIANPEYTPAEMTFTWTAPDSDQDVTFYIIALEERSGCLHAAEAVVVAGTPDTNPTTVDTTPTTADTTPVTTSADVTTATTTSAASTTSEEETTGVSMIAFALVALVATLF